MLIGRFLLLAFVNAMAKAQTALALHVGRRAFGRVAAGKVGGKRHDEEKGTEETNRQQKRGDGEPSTRLL
jgi:hypothetical protein